MKSKRVDIELPIECPKCGHTYKRKLRELPDGTAIDCPSCGQPIVMQGSGATDAQQAIDDLGDFLDGLKL